MAGDGEVELSAAGDAVAVPVGSDPARDLVIALTLKTIRSAVAASVLFAALLAIDLFVVRPPDAERALAVVMIALTLAIAGVAALVDWERVIRHRDGRALVWMWAFVTVGIVLTSIAATGGGSSHLFVALFVVLAFLGGPMYPALITVLLDTLAIVGYVSVVAASPESISDSHLGLNVAILVAGAIGVNFSAREVTRGFRLQLAQRDESANRAELWRTVTELMGKIESPDADKVLSRVVEATTSLGLDAADIVRIDRSAGTYRVLEARGLDPVYVEVAHPLTDSLVASVLEADGTVVQERGTDVRSDRGEVFRTTIASPVRVRDETIAILEAGTVRETGITPEMQAAFETLAAQAGRALESAQLIEDERAGADELRRLLQAAPDPMLIVDDRGTVVRASDRAADLFGYRVDELIGMDAPRLIPIPFRDQQLEQFFTWRDLGGEEVLGLDETIWISRKDGSEVPVEVVLSRIVSDGEVLYAGAVRDVTERREFERRLAHQATHDQLTGIANRAFFLEELDRLLGELRQGGAPLTVLLVDLDHFKYTNESRGHRVGDALVVGAAERIGALVGDHFLARVGGDAFGLIVTGLAGRGDAAGFAEHLLDAFREPFEIDNIESFVGISIGIAFGSPGDHADVLMRNADAAMYRAKTNGRGRVEFFDEQLTIDAAHRLATESALHMAISRGEFHLVYQPVVHLGTSRMVGCEALLRWRHPTQGMIPPISFIGTAEDTGLIVPIGRIVLRQAAEQLAEWRDRHETGADLAVSVNVSGRQLETDQFVGDLATVLAETDIPPRLLTLEITESVFIRDFDAALARLEAMRALGVRLAIDDFGTGFSSLFSLSRLPVDVVKIDKAFIDGLGSRYDSVVSAVVGLGEAFDLQVVAEGIEESTQCERLEQLGCRFAQGYLFARPMEPSGIADILAAGGRVERAVARPASAAG